MSQPIKLPLGKKIKLDDFDPDYMAGHDEGRRKMRKKLTKITNEIIELQELLYAESKHALLIVLQAMDAGGKDGTIKHVMGAVNPQGCDVVSFKVPSDEEAAHDFLWRAHKAAPRKGKIVIFNRSHYEDVLVTRVHNFVPKSVWKKRYDQINEFEKILSQSQISILKFFLYISKKEQKKRFKERLENPDKHWKFSPADLRERAHWDSYMEAFEDVFNNCNTKWAPWHIIPSNDKRCRDLIIAETIAKTLKNMNMKYPEPSVDIASINADDII